MVPSASTRAHRAVASAPARTGRTSGAFRTSRAGLLRTSSQRLDEVGVEIDAADGAVLDLRGRDRVLLDLAGVDLAGCVRGAAESDHQCGDRDDHGSAGALELGAHEVPSVRGDEGVMWPTRPPGEGRPSRRRDRIGRLRDFSWRDARTPTCGHISRDRQAAAARDDLRPGRHPPPRETGWHGSRYAGRELVPRSRGYSISRPGPTPTSFLGACRGREKSEAAVDRITAPRLRWQVLDSNQRRLCRLIYSQLPLAARATCQGCARRPVV